MELNQRLDKALSVAQEPWKAVISSETIQNEFYQKVKIPATVK